MATLAQRQHLHALMVYGLNHEHAIHYAQTRPMHSTGLSERGWKYRVEHGGVYMDCSEAVYLYLRLAGLNVYRAGYGSGGYGNSHTLWASLHNHYTDPSKALVGAVVCYGAYGNDHVCFVMDDIGSHDPWLWGHGSEGGPRRVRWSAENAIHGGTGVLCAISGL